MLILGWNNRTPRLVENLVRAEARVARFLDFHGSRRLRIVILAEQVTPARVAAIRDRIGRRFPLRRITLRSGTPMRGAHLARVDYRHAAVILLPAREFEADSAPDELTIKALMSAAHARDADRDALLPLVVAEILDPDRLATARRAYPGDAEFVGTTLIISRLLAQNARHAGLSHVYNELLGAPGAQGGNRLFVRRAPALAGERLVDIAGCFERALLLGVARDGAMRPLYADHDERLGDHDALAFLARDFEHCVADRAAEAVDDAARRSARPAPAPPRRCRVLVLGWNRKLPSLLAEFEAYRRADVAIDVLSLLGIDERETLLRRRGIALAHARVRQLEGDLTSHADLAALELGDYDCVMLVASDWLGSADAADARMLLGYFVLSRVLEGIARPPRVLVETLSADNDSLFAAAGVERLVSPDLQAAMLTTIALRRELHWVMDELFGAGGAEIEFRSPCPEDAGKSFATLAREFAARDAVLLGALSAPGRPTPRLCLNPSDREAVFELGTGDRFVVLAAY